jgi:hypothetical protein
MVENENTGTGQNDPVQRTSEVDDPSELDDSLLLPLSTNWNGKTVGCYIRNSTAAQVGNDRAAFQAGYGALPAHNGLRRSSLR